MANAGDTAWMVIGHSESGDEYHWSMAHEPSKRDLLAIIQSMGDDAGVAAQVTVDEIDEDGYLEHDRYDESDEFGPGFGGSYIHLSVKKTTLL